MKLMVKNNKKESLMHDNRDKITRDIVSLSRIDHKEIDNRVLSQKEIEHILHQLRSNYDHQLIFKLALCTGMKPNEIVRIRLDEINHETESIRVPNSDTSTDENFREIGLNHELYLEVYRFSHSLRNNRYLFEGRWGRMSWRSLSYILSKSTLPNGKKLTMKLMQDAVALTHLKSGFTLRELAYIMGYKNKIALRRRIKKLSSCEKGRMELFSSIFLKSA